MHSTSANFEGREQQDISEDFESDYLQTVQSSLQTQSMELVLGVPITPTQSIEQHNVSSGHQEIYV